MKLTFLYGGKNRTLNKHPQIMQRLKAGLMTEAEARATGWYYRQSVNGKKHPVKLPANDADAIRACKDLLKAVSQNPVGFAAYQQIEEKRKGVTIQDLADEWLSCGMPKNKTDRRTIAQVNELKPKFMRALSWWGPKSAEAVNATTCEDYAAFRTPYFTGADREISALSCLFQWAVFMGKIKMNPIGKRRRFGKVKAHCFEKCPDNDEMLHQVMAYCYRHSSDSHHPQANRNMCLSASSLLWSALVGLRPGEPERLLRIPEIGLPAVNPLKLPFGQIFQDRAGQRRMRVFRTKRGQNPFVLLHPAAADFLAAWQKWIAANFPTSKTLFPRATEDGMGLNRALNIASEKLGLPHFTPHSMRAFYVKVRRSQGADDSTIASELGQTSKGDLIRNTYGNPDELVGGKMFDWLPEDAAPAWNLLALPLIVVNPVRISKPKQTTLEAIPA